jgi:molybdopterin molybdotransferase
VVCDFDYRKKEGRREFVRARLKPRPGQLALVEKFGRSGAGILSSLVGSDGFIILPEALENLKAGDEVDFLSFHEVLSL